MFKNDTDPLRLATTPLDILTLPIVCLMFSLVCSLSYPPSLFLLFTTSGRPFLVWFELYLHIIWFDHTGRFIELFGADDSRPLPRLHAIYNPFDAVHVGNRRQPTAVYIISLLRLLSWRCLRGCRDLRTSTTATP